MMYAAQHHCTPPTILLQPTSCHIITRCIVMSSVRSVEKKKKKKNLDQSIIKHRKGSFFQLFSNSLSGNKAKKQVPALFHMAHPRATPSCGLLCSFCLQQKKVLLDFQDHVNQQHPQLCTKCQGRQLWGC